MVNHQSQRLQSYLSQAGVASRRGVIPLIESGGVQVNGKIVREGGRRISPTEDEITVNGKKIQKTEKFSYYLFHKPLGVLTTMKDPYNRKTVADFFKTLRERLFPIGRLDQNTTGLLILTNDGSLSHALTHPGYGVRKTYLVTVNRHINDRKLSLLSKGVVIESGKTSPCQLKRLKSHAPLESLEVILHEGKKRQIRQMFESIGAQVVSLHRTSYGSLSLGNLRLGEFRELSAEEIRKLRSDILRSTPTH